MTKYAQFEGLPTRDQILEFIKTSKDPAGKREIAREFGLRGNEKITLKALLLVQELLEQPPCRPFLYHHVLYRACLLYRPFLDHAFHRLDQLRQLHVR